MNSCWPLEHTRRSGHKSDPAGPRGQAASWTEQGKLLCSPGSCMPPLRTQGQSMLSGSFPWVLFDG